MKNAYKLGIFGVVIVGATSVALASKASPRTLATAAQAARDGVGSAVIVEPPIVTPEDEDLVLQPPIRAPFQPIIRTPFTP